MVVVIVILFIVRIGGFGFFFRRGLGSDVVSVFWVV